MQHSDARPQWGHYYSVVPNGFYPGLSVPQGYPTQSRNYHAGHGPVYGGSVVASSSAVRSLRDPSGDDRFPLTGKPVEFGLHVAQPYKNLGCLAPNPIRLEFLPRTPGYTGRSTRDLIMFSVGGTLGVPLLMMQNGCPIDDGEKVAFPGWPANLTTVSWVLDYPGIYPESFRFSVVNAQNRPLTRFEVARNISAKIYKTLHRAEMSALGRDQFKWSLKDGQWRDLRLVALVLYPSLRRGGPQVWVPILAAQI